MSNQSRTRTTDESQSEESSQKEVCEECGGNVTVAADTNEHVCEDCGLIADVDNLDHGPDWRAYNQQERDQKSRVGPARTELRHDRGLSSTIDWKNQDAHGNQLSGSKRATMKRLRTWNKRAQRTGGDRGVSYANGEIQRMGSALGTPKSIQETAASLYRQAFEAGLIPGRSIEGVASATLYIALRVHESPRSLDEITNVSRVKRKPISRTQRYLCRELNIPLKPTNPRKYIPRFADALDADQDLIRTAEQLVEEVDGKYISGCDPTVLAAAALYAASIVEGELVTQRSIREAADVTEVSIRNNYKAFLIHPDSVPLTAEDLEDVSSPVSVAAKLNDRVDYNQSTRKQSSKSTNNNETRRTGRSESETVDESVSRSTETSSTKTREQGGQETMTDGDTDTGASDVSASVEEGSNRTSESEPVVEHDEHHAGTDAVDAEGDGADEDETGAEEDGEFDCDECDDSFDSERGLQIHKGVVHSDDEDGTEDDSKDDDYSEGDHDCPECPYATDTIRGVNIHIGRKHPNAELLDNPSESTDEEQDGEFGCDFCSFASDSYQGLRTHQGNMHDGKRNADDAGPPSAQPTQSETDYPNDEYNFECTECDRVTETYRGVTIHVGRSHPDADSQSREDYAVDPDTHPVTEVTPSTTGTSSGETGSDGDEGPRVEPEFREYVTAFFAELDGDVLPPATKRLAESLLLAGGRNVGTDSYRSKDTAIAAASYAAGQALKSLLGDAPTQAEVADLVGVTQLPVSSHYEAYLHALYDSDVATTTIQ